MIEFCRDHDLPHQLCGKVIVATRTEEFPRLGRKLRRRGEANWLTGPEIDRTGTVAANRTTRQRTARPGHCPRPLHHRLLGGVREIFRVNPDAGQDRFLLPLP